VDKDPRLSRTAQWLSASCIKCTYNSVLNISTQTVDVLRLGMFEFELKTTINIIMMTEIASQWTSRAEKQEGLTE